MMMPCAAEDLILHYINTIVCIPDKVRHIYYNSDYACVYSGQGEWFYYYGNVIQWKWNFQKD